MKTFNEKAVDFVGAALLILEINTDIDTYDSLLKLAELNLKMQDRDTRHLCSEVSGKSECMNAVAG